MRGIDRRSFLALGVGAVAWACSRGGEEDDAQPTGAAGAISIVATGLQLAVGDSRQGFAVIRDQEPYVPDEMRVRLTPPGRKALAVDVEQQRITFGYGGEAEGAEVKDIFTFRREFDRPGIWVIDVTADGKSSKAAFQVVSKDQDGSPLVGEKALATESPTTTDPRGVDPICTRNPRCSMHDLTIADALAASKPVVIVFGTPRFCTSRTCGPVVDIVENAKKKFGDEASFVHVEVWRNDEDAINKPDGTAPAFAEWKLSTEPWTYFIDEEGVVRDRWIGALGVREVETGVDGLLGTGPYPRFE